MSLRESAEQELKSIESGIDSKKLKPEPLPELPPVDAFDYAFLPDAVREFASDVTERMQCPADFAGVNLYVMLGALIGNKIGIKPKRRDSWVVVPNLWGSVIGGSGIMKSPNRGEILKPLKQLQRELAQEISAANIEAINAQTVAELRKKEIKALARKRLKQNIDDPNVIQLFKNSDPKPNTETCDAQVLPEVKTPPRFITNDCTAEALGELMIKNPNGILYEADELIGLLKSLDKPGQEGARAFFLTAADGTQGFTIDRIMRGQNLHIEKACLSIIGAIQPGVIAEYVRGALSGGSGADGLLQRFGLMVYPDVTSTYQYIDTYPNKEARQAVNDLVKRLYDLDVEAVATIGEFDRTPYLSFDDSAQEIFIDWLIKLENRLRTDDDHPAIVSHLSKYRKLIPALALINHLCDSTASKVTEPALLRALAYGEYLESHARRVYSHGTQPGVDAAKAILSRLKKGKLSDSFSLRDVYRKCWAGIDTPAKAQTAIDVLIEYGHLSRDEIFTDGRPATIYRWVKVQS